MLRKYSEALNGRMTAAGVEGPSADVIEYALKIIFNTVLITALSMLVGVITGEPGKTVAVLVGFALLRFVTGGYHIKGAFACIAVSTVVMSVIPHISLPQGWTYGLTAAAFLLVAVFAPANYDKYAWATEKHYPLLKCIGLAIVASNFLFVSETLALTYIIQAGLLPFREGGEEQ